MNVLYGRHREAWYRIAQHGHQLPVAARTPPKVETKHGANQTPPQYDTVSPSAHLALNNALMLLVSGCLICLDK
jgi:hypothetical protein